MRFKYRVNRLIFQLCSLFRLRQAYKPDTALFVPYDAVGDLLITTAIFSQLKKSSPNLQIDVLATHRNYLVLKNNPHVRNVYVTYGKNILFSQYERQLTKRISQQRYELVVDLWDRVSFSILFRLILFKAKKIIGLRKPKSVEINKKLRTEKLGVYDVVVENDAVTFRGKMLAILSYFNVNPINNPGELYPSKEDERYSEEVVNSEKRTLYLNLFGSHSSNTLPKGLLLPLINTLLTESNFDVLISSAGKNENQAYLRQAFSTLGTDRIKILNSSITLMQEACVIKASDYIGTMNTATLHIAQAFDKKLMLLEDKRLTERYTQFPVMDQNETILFFNEPDFIVCWRQELRLMVAENVK